MFIFQNNIRQKKQNNKNMETFADRFTVTLLLINQPIKKLKYIKINNALWNKSQIK